MRYAVVMAGGAGTRLWPLSRADRPKQLLPLIGGKNLLQMSIERLRDVFPPENIWIITNAEYADQVSAAIPELPRRNIIGEPMGRDTANAIATACELLAATDERATMAVFTADHVIRPLESFKAAVIKACETVEQNPDSLLTFGIRPTWPNTALGYIHCGDAVTEGVRKVAAFKEKPDHHTARRYVESGRHYWNSGMFVWKVSTIRELLRQLLPETMEKLAGLSQAASGGGDYCRLLAKAYPELKKISIDFAVMEKAPKVLMLELGCEWLDVGSWPALEGVSELDDSGNVVAAKNTAVMDSFRNVIVTEDDHLLAVLGVDDCIIVHSPDATLVCAKSDSQRLKELVAVLERKYGRRYL